MNKFKLAIILSKKEIVNKIKKFIHINNIKVWDEILNTKQLSCKSINTLLLFHSKHLLIFYCMTCRDSERENIDRLLEKKLCFFYKYLLVDFFFPNVFLLHNLVPKLTLNKLSLFNSNMLSPAMLSSKYSKIHF